MYFTKYPHPANFAFVDSFEAETSTLAIGEQRFVASITSYEGDIYHVKVANDALWGGNKCLEKLNLPKETGQSHITVGTGFELSLQNETNQPVLSTVEGAPFGVCGEASLFQFVIGEGAQFFGMGEKTFGKVELSGYRTKFWNTDVWGDFHVAHWGENPTDPPYFSTPYVVAKVGDQYVGFLLHNPYPTFIETPGTDESRVFVEWQRTSPHLILGSEGGEPNLWIIYGPSLRDVTQKLQRLVGVTPLPPIWSIGYHQSRWGYGGHTDLTDLDAQFEKFQIPCDALWLDLDYMDGYRIFKTSDAMFPKGVQATLSVLEKNDRKIVPILDPGVKLEKGYSVYEDGLAKNVFCKNPQGKPFVGLVWPGETVFPDFSQQETRGWWSGYVKAFAEEGFAGTWCDMNDPSTGPVDPHGMLFNNGTEPHTAHHNQYALGMQMATKDGFLQARPNERPFVLSRSGFIGSSKNAAIWTGDNVSNYFYLAISIPTTLGLSLSGQPFNGPDLGGFGGDCSDALLIDWTKAGFLFPFMRNHSNKGNKQQEPFAYPDATMQIVRRYIRLRYKLLPYLYNLFIDQELHGDPILRPLFYEFKDKGLELINDQFLVGSDILQAPFVTEAGKTRKVTLPGSHSWYDASNGHWEEAGEHTVKRDKGATPLYVKTGAIIPMQAGTPTTNAKELSKVHFHIFMPEGWTGDSESTYSADDGISFAYQAGKRSSLKIKAVSVDGNLAVGYEQTADGFGAIEPTFVIHGSPKSVRINGSAVTLQHSKVTLTGKPLSVVVCQ